MVGACGLLPEAAALLAFSSSCAAFWVKQFLRNGWMGFVAFQSHHQSRMHNLDTCRSDSEQLGASVCRKLSMPCT